MSEDTSWERGGIEHSKSMQRAARMTFKDSVGSAGDFRNWPVWLLVLVCSAVFVAQWTVPISYVDWGFSGKAMDDGRYLTIVTSLFMHGGLLHIFMNMSVYLSFAPIVCARFGRGFAAFFPFYLFFILCGLAGNGLFWLIHLHGSVPVVGASGAIYGLVGAFFRLDLSQDRLRGLFSKPMLSGWRWLMVSNLTVILIFGGPAILVQLLSGHVADLSIPIAWEAHVGGFIAGVILISLMAGRGWKGEWRAGIRFQDAAEGGGPH